MVKALHDELLNLGLTASKLDSLDQDKFSRLHRPVGKIKLYGLTDKVNRALELSGRSERVTEGKYRSVYHPDMLTEPLIKFCGTKKFAPSNRGALNEAIRRVKKKFGKRTANPLTLEQSYHRLLDDKYDHFSGLPLMGRKDEDKDALKRAEQCWRGKCPPPSIIGHRGKNTEVVRAVWMLPFEWHIVEGCFYYAIYDVIKDVQKVYPVGPLSERRYLMRKYCGSSAYNTKFSIDYSGYDSSLGTQMIGIAFDILGSILKLNEKEAKIWKRIQVYFSTCPFLAPDGLVYKGRRGGVPSGSMFTQIVDTVCNAVAIEYSMLVEGVKNYRYLVYGDDSWTVLYCREEPHKLLCRIKSHVGELGLQMNVDKTAYAEPDKPIVFCGHYDIKRGRPTQDAIDKLCYPERPSKAFTTRKGLCERLIAYMADGDATWLNPVYLSIYYNRSIEEVLSGSYSQSLVEVFAEGGCTAENTRHLPGILQTLQLAPRTTSSLMKIRAAI